MRAHRPSGMQFTTSSRQVTTGHASFPHRLRIVPAQVLRDKHKDYACAMMIRNDTNTESCGHTARSHIHCWILLEMNAEEILTVAFLVLNNLNTWRRNMWITHKKYYRQPILHVIWKLVLFWQFPNDSTFSKWFHVFKMIRIISVMD